MEPWMTRCIAALHARHLLIGGALLLAGCSGDDAPRPILASTVVAGIHHSCGLATDGSTWCWGAMYGDAPSRLDGWPALRMVTAGVYGSCGLTNAGTAHCWGMNNNGQLGDGTTTGRNEPAPVAGGHTFAHITTGILHSCGVTLAGIAYCWGWNSNGQLGDGTQTSRATPVPVAGGLAFEQIDSYSTHTCGLTTAGTAYCWGDNRSGGIGDGTTIERHTPAAVSGGHTFTQLATGSSTCGLTATGAIYCWGLKYGTTPVLLAGAPSFTSISSGGGHTCGLTAAGEAYCWGWNGFGQVGDGTTLERADPVPVAGGLTFAALSATGWRHTCGLTRNGVTYCWGSNVDGELGDGTTTSRLTPARTAEWVRPHGS
jgi:alpha-tubulin suppressor-like RCC1 family protein